MRTLTDAELDVVGGGKRKKIVVIKDSNFAVVAQSNSIDDIEIKAIKSTVTVTVAQSNSSTVTQS
jgi:hypothetical protein